MTNEQRKRITELRQGGYGYTTIAKALGMTKGGVKTYCHAHGLAGTKAKSNARIIPEYEFCRQCGTHLEQIQGRKRRKFCSEACRKQWWNMHPEQVHKKAIYSFTCAGCGKAFTAYGKANRKYCSHACYIAARFKNGKSLEQKANSDREAVA